MSKNRTLLYFQKVSKQKIAVSVLTSITKKFITNQIAF